MRVLSTSKRILITGASQGIDRTAALLLARQGHTLILAARSLDNLERVASEIRALGDAPKSGPWTSLTTTAFNPQLQSSSSSDPSTWW